jgi:hypothetical protein
MIDIVIMVHVMMPYPDNISNDYLGYRPPAPETISLEQAAGLT